MFSLYLGRRGEGKEGRAGVGGETFALHLLKKNCFSLEAVRIVQALPLYQSSSDLLSWSLQWLLLIFTRTWLWVRKVCFFHHCSFCIKKENVPSVSCPPNSQAPPSPFGCINLVTVYFFLRPGTNYVLGGGPSEGTAPWTAVIQVTFSRTHLCTLSIFSSSFFRVSSVSFICSDP